MMPSKQEMMRIVRDYCMERNCNQCCIHPLVDFLDHCWSEPIDYATIQQHYLLVKEAQNNG